MKNILNFFNDFKNEFFKVEWPSEKEASSLTILVLILCTVTSLYLGVFDIVIKTLSNYIL